MTKYWTRPVWMGLAAAGGFFGVAWGAFAAHAMTDPAAKELLKTASSYDFMHAMATFACAGFMGLGARRARLAPAFFLAGIALFSGSLVALALGAPKWVGAITPFGGVSFLIGWAVLIWAAFEIDRKG